jgi:hypothetical protein
MTNEDLGQYSALLAASFGRALEEKVMYKDFYEENEAMLKADSAHPPLIDELQRAEKDGVAAIKDDLAVRPQTPSQQARFKRSSSSMSASSRSIAMHC